MTKKKSNVIYIADWRKKHMTNEQVEDMFRQACEISDVNEASNRARQLYETVLEVRPEHADAWTNLGNLHYAQGSNTKALACWKKALKINPLQAEGRYNVAYALHQSGKFKQALSEYLLCIELEPDFADAHFNVADIYIMLDNKERACQHLEKFIELVPAGDFTESARSRLNRMLPTFG